MSEKELWQNAMQNTVRFVREMWLVYVVMVAVVSVTMLATLVHWALSIVVFVIGVFFLLTYMSYNFNKRYPLS